ncbi:hypothetical protein DPMN_128643 [Dreissena polymorpha]|uniref:Uncharacterized protein n=1 Tax=Dreissena polymorpha TaxID=45954 RepID=A0A9D4H196_DREPO|nr:hypothetical protein DPMN_128643 [Dreissena polymorpha]
MYMYYLLGPPTRRPESGRAPKADDSRQYVPPYAGRRRGFQAVGGTGASRPDEEKRQSGSGMRAHPSDWNGWVP